MVLVPFPEIGSRHQLEILQGGEVDVARDFVLDLMGFDHVLVDLVDDLKKGQVRYL
jgi:hypothetical protein